MCTKCKISIDQARADKFAERMIAAFNQTSITMMCSIGYRTGLFDTMAELEPSTSQQIADAAQLNERYVREWLGAMVTGRIIDYDPESKTYALPPEHAAWLTRKSAPNNLAVTTQWFAVMASVEDRVVECFKNGGGLAYEEYNRFHEVMADESHQTVVAPLVGQLLPLADGIKEKLNEGIAVLDVGCGSGKALIELAREFPNSRFTGYDLCQDAISRAEAIANSAGVSNITFVSKDVSEFNDKEKFDLIFTFDAVHDQAKPGKVLSNIFKALKPDGLYFCQDIAGSSHVEKNMEHPVAPFIYTISCTHCMSVSLGQGGAGLGAMWGKEKALEMFKEAGFTRMEVKNLEHDFINNYYLVRK